MRGRKPDTFRGEASDHEILILWRAGKDTFDIAKQLWQPEHHIAGRLPAILGRARQDQEWNFDRIASQ